MAAGTAYESINQSSINQSIASGRRIIFAGVHPGVRPPLPRPPTVVGLLAVVREFSQERTKNDFKSNETTGYLAPSTVDPL